MKKRSITIAGHPTSITLEDAFWQQLKLAATAQGLSLAALVTQIDAARNLNTNLSSALRLYVLNRALRD